MKENKYDSGTFFKQYSQMPRSRNGLADAGEWHIFRKMFPDLKDQEVLDLGCGFGWHCQYAAEQGAKSVIGTDISKNMLARANNLNRFDNVKYKQIAIEDIHFQPNSFDVVMSSLAFHYVQSFQMICGQVRSYLRQGGSFIFSVEHPVFTAQGPEDWYYDENGKRLHWPVDSYFNEGQRVTKFLGDSVIKYHRTLTGYINTLIKNGFEIKELIEPTPNHKSLTQYPEYKDELRRPIFLLISAKLK